MAYGILEVHVYIPPVDLMFQKAQVNAATRICVLPANHPLHPLVQRIACCYVNQHKTPLHHLPHITQLNPKATEKVASVCRHPSYKLSFSTKVSPSKETAPPLAQAIHHSAHYKMCCDGSSLKGGVGAAAMLYKNDMVIKICKYHLGTPEEHSVYEAELTGIILASHLLFKIACQITRKTVISLDNQVVIQALNTQSTKPSHYHLNQIHTAAERLHKK